MKVAHSVFSVASNSGGIGPVVQGITTALSAMDGVETNSYVPVSGYAEDFPTPLKTFDSLGPPKHCLSPRLIQQIAADQNDLIHCHGIWTFLARTNLAWNKSGKPYVISPHGMTMPAAMEFSRLKKKLFWPWMEKSNLNHAAFIHALSSFEAESVRALGIRTPIVQIGNGVDLPLTVASQRTNTAANDGVRTLLYLGRLHPIKGVDKLIKAWKSAGLGCRSKDQWKLQVVGWGQADYVQTLESQTRDDHSIVFSGPLFGDEKHLAMNKAHAFVLPSSSEAFPMALMEAWSHGLPAVATQTCNVLNRDDDSVSLFVDDTEEEIVRGIQEIAGATDGQRQAMGDAARAVVEADYSWPKIAKNFIAAYRWGLGLGSEPTDLMYD